MVSIAQLDTGELLKEVVVTIRIRTRYITTFRMWIGLVLIKLGVKIYGCGSQIEE
jgi:hypothetical protein